MSTQSPEKETKECTTKDHSKRSRTEETESPERPTHKNRPSHLETKGSESKKHTMKTNITNRTDISGPLFSKQDSRKDDRASAATGGGPCPKDSNSDIAEEAENTISDTVFNKLKKRMVKSKYTHEEDIKAKEIRTTASSEENAAPATEASDHVTQSKVPSEKKKPKEKTKVVTAVKDWSTIKKPMINIANIRHFQLASGNKKNTQKQQIEDEVTAGQAPRKKPDIGLPADVDSASTKGQVEDPENDVKDKARPDQNDAHNENVGTDSQHPLRSASDKEDCVSELSEGEIRSESSKMQGDSDDNSPRSDNLEEELEVFSAKKRRKGGKTKKKRRAPVRESVQTEDSGDESGCSESSSYYQLVKKPKKKSVKDRKKAVKKKTKAEASRMSRKAVIRKSRRHSRSSSEEEDDGDSESFTSYDSPPPAKHTKTKKSKKKSYRSPVAKRGGSKKSRTGSTKVRKSSKKNSTSAGKKRSKVSLGTKASSSKAKSKRKHWSDSSSSSSASDSPERRPKRKLKTVKKGKTKRKKYK